MIGKRNLPSLYLAIPLWLIAANASLRAADITWINSSGGLWSVAANWSPNQVVNRE